MTGDFNPRLPTGGRVRKIKVPVVDIDREWRRFFGDERIDLLKVDIEGGEVAFLKAHAPFLEKVDAILIEWHAWVTTLEEVSSIGSSSTTVRNGSSSSGRPGVCRPSRWG